MSTVAVPRSSRAHRWRAPGSKSDVFDCLFTIVLRALPSAPLLPLSQNPGTARERLDLENMATERRVCERHFMLKWAGATSSRDIMAYELSSAARVYCYRYEANQCTGVLIMPSVCVCVC